MTAKAPESPVPVYRGLDRCDLCGGALAPGEQLAGICAACRRPDPRRKSPTSTGRKHAHKLL
jgi:hypothetical protein